MRKKVSYYLVLSVLLTLGIVSGAIRQSQTSSKVEGASSDKSWDSAKVMIVPHHKLAKDLVVHAYDHLPKDSYQYVVLLGPNHFFPESPTITLADNIDGVNIDSNFTFQLANEFDDVVIDSAMVAGDHSIMIQVPYIKDYFPSAKVLTLLVAPYYSLPKVDQIVSYLYKNLPENTLYIASVDFSHNTLQLEALQRNEESIKAIENFDYEKLASFDDFNMDSPLSIIMAAKLAKLYGYDKWQTLYSSHASIVLNDNTIKGTSYVIGAFLKSSGIE